MQTKHQPVMYLLCTKCSDIYMRVGDTSIGLAQLPRARVFIMVNPKYQGPCPKHRKALVQ